MEEGAAVRALPGGGRLPSRLIMLPKRRSWILRAAAEVRGGWASGWRLMEEVDLDAAMEEKYFLGFRVSIGEAQI